MKIRTGDTVMIMSGSRKYKGTTWKVLRALPASSRVVVEGVNIATKHIKKYGTNPGQIIKMEKSIDVSNVMLVCPITEKPTRIWYVMTNEKGVQKKWRYSKRAVKETGKNAVDCIIK